MGLTNTETFRIARLALVVIAIAVLPPAVYVLTAITGVRAEAQVRVDSTALLVGELATRSPDLWEFQIARLQHKLAFVAGREICEVRRIVDPSGREIASIAGKAPDSPLWPRLMVSSAVHDAGRVVAVVEFLWSTKTVVLAAGRLALLSALLGCAAYLAIRRFPLRALEEAWRRMAFMASHDLLTKLPDRHALLDHLVQVLASADRRGDKVAVLCLDLDRFKDVNDTLGHAAGDQLLVAVADQLSQHIRTGDVLARLGGDEFAVIQQSASQQPEGSAALAERLIECLAPPFQIDDRQVSIGVSIGIALAQWGSNSMAGDLMVNADMALYKAKECGRNTYCFFEPSMNDQVRKRKTLEAELEAALADGQFEVHYQPQLDLVSNTVDGVEALLRWRHPERGLLLPGEYIPVAEDSGLIVPIGEWVLRRACEEITAYDGLSVAVNLSPAQLGNGDLLDRVEAVLAETGLEPQRLELEITERVLMAEDEGTMDALQRLHRLGVRFALDDFGTGYASLSYLGKFPFSKIKIDRSFIGDIEEKDEAFAIVRASIGLSRSLGIRAMAEGLETTGQPFDPASRGMSRGSGVPDQPAAPRGRLGAVPSARLLPVTLPADVPGGACATIAIAGRGPRCSGVPGIDVGPSARIRRPSPHRLALMNHPPVGVR